MSEPTANAQDEEAREQATAEHPEQPEQLEQPEPASPPPFPSWRDHFRAPVIWADGRESVAAQPIRVPLDPVHPHERHSEARATAEVPTVAAAAAAVGAAAGDAIDAAGRLAREVADMSQEERAAQMQRLAAGMRPISSDAERLVVRALDLGATGLSRLADRIERRARTASGLPRSPRSGE